MASPNPPLTTPDRHISVLQQTASRTGGQDAIQLALDALPAANDELAARVRFEDANVTKQGSRPSRPPETIQADLERASTRGSRILQGVAKAAKWILGIHAAAFAVVGAGFWGYLGRERNAGYQPHDHDPNVVTAAVTLPIVSVALAGAAVAVHSGTRQNIALKAFGRAVGAAHEARRPLLDQLTEMAADEGRPADPVAVEIEAEELINAVRAREEIAERAVVDPSYAFTRESVSEAYAARGLGSTGLAQAG